MFIENKILRTNINAIDYNVAILMQLILIKNNATIVRCTDYFFGTNYKKLSIIRIIPF